MNPEETDTQGKTLKVAVVGGSICGLALAIGLTKAGIDVEIYEAAPKFGEVGAGVGLDPNAIRVLRELEILEDVVASCQCTSRSTRATSLPVLPGDSWVRWLGIHRVTFLEALVHLVDPSKTYFNKRCTGLQAGVSHGIQLIFADGTSAEADVVIGADGIRSAVRTFVVEGSANKDGTTEDLDAELRVVRGAFTNTHAYRGLIPVEQLKNAGVQIDLSERLHCFTGPGKFIIAFPIKQDTVVNVVAFVCDRSIAWGERPLPAGTPWVTPRTTEELLETYTGWGCDAQLLLGCLLRSSVWAVHAVDPHSESYVRGKVALIGDAVHGMLPHLGAGAGQGLEDVLVLVRLLAHPQMRVGNVEVRGRSRFSFFRSRHGSYVHA